MDNYDDVLAQLGDAGLVIDGGLDVNGRIVRCYSDDDRREKRGWYVLHQIPATQGGSLIVGSYGVWRGNERDARKIMLRKSDRITDEQRRAIKIRLAEDCRLADARRKHLAESAARRAESVWAKCLLSPADGRTPDYLARKAVGAHGIRYTPSGAIVVPLHDGAGRIHGLQFILSRQSHAARIKRLERDKEYWPKGLAKRGNYCLIGSPSSIALVAEGYATAATLHEATGLPVAIAFDAGNLLPVAEVLRARYPRARILVCADDDYLTPGNPGVTAAQSAALAVRGAHVVPAFQVDRQGAKLTDYNDLAAQAGIALVRAQIEAAIAQLGWTQDGGRLAHHEGGEGAERPPLSFDLDRLISDFALIYGTDTAFDGRLHRIVGLGPLRSAAGRNVVRSWLEHPERRIVLPEAVGFDPSESDTSIACNLWSGWPTKPQHGDCDLLLDLLEVLCSHDDDARGLLEWVTAWLAYPIQHPGAKMASALLVHGPEGTGKNTFFATVRKIYGHYGCQFSQTELESQFNGWASGKLFAIGNEVVSRAELYHLQGRLKSMITESEWVINEKMLPARLEQNHANFVFFSNRVDIAKLDPDDRRYAVVWTPPALDRDFYRAVAEQISNGGIAALHHHLLHLDLGDFGPHTPPPQTTAKLDLIGLGMDSTERFWREWVAGDLDCPCIPCRSQDLYDYYRYWSAREGVPKPAQKQTLLTMVGKKPGTDKRQERYVMHGVAARSMCVFPPDARGICQSWPQDGSSPSHWLGAHVARFASALDAAKGGPGVV